MLRLAVFAVIAAFYFCFPNGRPDFSRFDAEDGEMYLALSFGLTHGLGYTRNLVAGEYIPNTTWPPGMALLLAPATAFAHLPIDWALMKLPIISIAVAGIALTWLLVRRLADSEFVADAAALLLALNPFYWDFSRMDLSEIPTIVWIIFSVLIIDVVWANRSVRWHEAGALGLLIGLGMLIKSAMFGLALAPLAYLAGSRRTRLTPRHGLLTWLIYAAGFSSWFMVWYVRDSWITRHYYSWNDCSGASGDISLDHLNQLRMVLSANGISDPYGPLSSVPQMVHSVYNNLVYHAIYRLPEQTFPGINLVDWSHWPGAPVIALVLSGLLLAAILVARNGAPLVVVAICWGALLCIFSSGGAARYWLAVSLIALILLAMRIASTAAARGSEFRAVGMLALVLIYGACLALYIARHEANPLLPDRAQLADLFRQSETLPNRPAAMLTYDPMAYTFITGIPAPLTAVGLGIEPKYTDVITRTDRVAYPSTERAPPGAMALLTSGPWQLLALPRPMTLREIRAASGASAGLSCDDRAATTH